MRGALPRFCHRGTTCRSAAIFPRIGAVGAEVGGGGSAGWGTGPAFWSFAERIAGRRRMGFGTWFPGNYSENCSPRLLSCSPLESPGGRPTIPPQHVDPRNVLFLVMWKSQPDRISMGTRLSTAQQCWASTVTGGDRHSKRDSYVTRPARGCHLTSWAELAELQTPPEQARAAPTGTGQRRM